MRTALLIEYLGTDFAGWQVQPRARTVQGEIARAIRRVAGVPAVVHGSGRTDAGVHALGQVAHADLPDRVPVDRLAAALNAALPPDLSILRAAVAPPGFDARRSAIRRVYRYVLRWGPPPASVFERGRVGFFFPALDLGAMAEAARRFEGTRDVGRFASAGASAGRPGKVRTVRTVETCRLEIDPDGPRGAVLEVAAPSFLMHQVRRIVGALVEVGRGRVAPADVLSARAVTAPAAGLYLVRVEYPATLDPFAP
jgi:tRNA pseudouridine38-40 synthase